MTTRADIVAEARGWLGTPFHKHASIKGRGADCIGFVYGVGFALGLLPDYRSEGPWSRFVGYSHRPAPQMMRQALSTIFPLAEHPAPRDGDVLWVKAPDFPTHLGIFAGGDLLHAWAPHKLIVAGPYVPARFRLTLLFAYPGFEGDAP